MYRAVAVVLAAVALGCTPTSAGGGSSSATVRVAKLEVVKRAPLTVGGRGFRAGESVRVSAVRRTWRVRANPDGRFVLVIGTGGDRCSQVRVLAVGSGGSRAILKALPSPECAPARTP